MIFVGRSVPWVNTRIRCGNPAGWFLRAEIILAKMGWRAECKVDDQNDQLISVLRLNV